MSYFGAIVSTLSKNDVKYVALGCYTFSVRGPSGLQDIIHEEENGISVNGQLMDKEGFESWAADFAAKMKEENHG